MERYLKRLDRDLWRSIEEEPHVPILTHVAVDGARARLGGCQASMNKPTKNDLEKMEKD